MPRTIGIANAQVPANLLDANCIRTMTVQAGNSGLILGILSDPRARSEGRSASESDVGRCSKRGLAHTVIDHGGWN